MFFVREGLGGWNLVNLQRPDQAMVVSLLPTVGRYSNESHIRAMGQMHRTRQQCCDRTGAKHCRAGGKQHPADWYEDYTDRHARFYLSMS